MNKSNKAVIKGIGNECPKCKKPMERRGHPEHWVPTKPYYYHKWDYCVWCQHVQHYSEFKNQPWKELEVAIEEKQMQENHLKNI